jgi:hypothetical protein
MGCYLYINDQDRVNWRKVTDKEINEVLQEALQYDKSLMISEHYYLERKKIFSKKEKVYFYSVYHESFNDNGRSHYEAREQLSAGGNKRVVLAYLYGIINGANAYKR